MPCVPNIPRGGVGTWQIRNPTYRTASGTQQLESRPYPALCAQRDRRVPAPGELGRGKGTHKEKNQPRSGVSVRGYKFVLFGRTSRGGRRYAGETCCAPPRRSALRDSRRRRGWDHPPPPELRATAAASGRLRPSPRRLGKPPQLGTRPRPGTAALSARRFPPQLQSAPC